MRPAARMLFPSKRNSSPKAPAAMAMPASIRFVKPCRGFFPACTMLSLLTLAAIAFSDPAFGQSAPQPPGKLVEVGGHKMHIYCTGEVGPAVILEAGAGAFSLDWHLVQTKVAQFAQVCSYDRAGHAWSELGPRPRTMKQAVYDLHRLLLKAGIPGPYLLVGHSLGGVLVRVYASQYPEDVAGLVLVDTAPENSLMFINGKWVRWFDDAKGRPIPPVKEQIEESERSLVKEELEGYQKFREWLGPPKIEPPYTKLPFHIQELRLWAMAQPESNVTDFNPFNGEELVILFADRLRQEFPLGNKPLIILRRKAQTGLTKDEDVKRDQERIENTRSLLLLSRNSQLVVAEISGHEIHLDQPDLVVNAIRAVLEAVKNGTALKPIDPSFQEK
jgi:pimeloyl-ACP methyl ester carboxylesterase